MGIKVYIQLSDQDTKGLPNRLSLTDGSRLNVIVKGCLPMCHKCEVRGHIKNNYTELEISTEAVESQENVKEIEATRETMEVEQLQRNQ